ncbi:uncharacterized protein LOC114768366 isoform X2 [Denticeps clupeoides]|uniref:uncharacterized protein LOC114768366 isoform X2 n=1 Tax=Denticeps clupeoides TaxID=299321 RepID=UPI0010A56AA2|nr:uncharacterized protein LOC114768366 isoform X2 [Denticeps clupeoides]
MMMMMVLGINYMKSVVGVLMLITGRSHGLMFTCDARQNTTCYTALGHPVYLQLINVEQPQLSFTAGTQRIFNIKKNIITRQNLPPNWQFIISNWTLIINPVERKDTGTYRTESHDEYGKVVGINCLHLFIEAPVSSVTLNIACLPSSERRVTCSSSGDSPQYSWTLDGTPLGEGGTDVILKEEATGALTCTVTNNVSSVNKTQDLNPCRRPSTPQSTCPPQTVSGTYNQDTDMNEPDQHHQSCGLLVFITVWLAEIIVLTSLWVGFYYLYTRNNRSQTIVRKCRSHTASGTSDES